MDQISAHSAPQVPGENKPQQEATQLPTDVLIAKVAVNLLEIEKRENSTPGSGSLAEEPIQLSQRIKHVKEDLTTLTEDKEKLTAAETDETRKIEEAWKTTSTWKIVQLFCSMFESVYKYFSRRKFSPILEKLEKQKIALQTEQDSHPVASAAKWVQAASLQKFYPNPQNLTLEEKLNNDGKAIEKDPDNPSGCIFYFKHNNQNIKVYINPSSKSLDNVEYTAKALLSDNTESRLITQDDYPLDKLFSKTHQELAEIFTKEDPFIIEP